MSEGWELTKADTIVWNWAQHVPPRANSKGANGGGIGGADLGPSPSPDADQAPSISEVTARRLAMWRNGYRIVPVDGKAPVETGWPDTWKNIDHKDEVAAAKLIISWEHNFPNASNTGVINCASIDIDILHEAGAGFAEQVVWTKFNLPQTKLLRRVGQYPKRAFIFKTDGFSKMDLRLVPPGEEAPAKKRDAKNHIEILCDHLVVDGVHPITKKAYTWNAGLTPWTVKYDELPVLTEDLARDFQTEVVKFLEERGWREYYRSRGKGQPRRTGYRYQGVNDEAMDSFSVWVPKLFPGMAKPSHGGGFRISSEALQRDLEEDLSIHREGITDWGLHDEGDALAGRRTPVELWAEHGLKVPVDRIAKGEARAELDKAADLLWKALGHDDDWRASLEYEANLEGTWWRKRSGKDVSWVKLADFPAKVVEDIVMDDGSGEEQRFYVVASSFGTTRTPAATFDSLKWIGNAFGADACVSPGQGTGQRFIEAIKKLGADERVRRRVFGHTGWRKIDGKWHYLHAGCTGDVEVRLDGTLTHFILPAVIDAKAAMQASLRMLALAPPRVAYLLFAATYRAALGEWVPITAALWLYGKTGVRKTAAAMNVQAHFAPGLDRAAASWEGTPNALERKSFHAKDVVLLADDFVFKDGASQQDKARQYYMADRLCRGNANRSGRDRITADLRSRPDWYPRCLPLITGEDLPVGHSLRARMTMVEFRDGDVDLGVLTELQNNKLLLAEAMAAYTTWLAGQDHAAFAKRQFDLRSTAIKELKNAHGRTAENVAVFQLGIETALRFAVEIGALSEQEAKDHEKTSWKTMIDELAAEQVKLLQSQNPVERFITLIGSAISSGRAHVANADGGPPPEPEAMGWQVVGRDGAGEKIWRGQGKCVGWVKESLLYLDPEAAYAEVQSLASSRRRSWP